VLLSNFVGSAASVEVCALLNAILFCTWQTKVGTALKWKLEKQTRHIVSY